MISTIYLKIGTKNSPDFRRTFVHEGKYTEMNLFSLGRFVRTVFIPVAYSLFSGDKSDLNFRRNLVHTEFALQLCAGNKALKVVACDRDLFHIACRRPGECAALETLLVKPKTIAVPFDDLDPVMATVAEDK